MGLKPRKTEVDGGVMLGAGSSETAQPFVARPGERLSHDELDWPSPPFATVRKPRGSDIVAKVPEFAAILARAEATQPVPLAKIKRGLRVTYYVREGDAVIADVPASRTVVIPRDALLYTTNCSHPEAVKLLAEYQRRRPGRNAGDDASAGRKFAVLPAVHEWRRRFATQAKAALEGREMTWQEPDAWIPPTLETMSFVLHRFEPELHAFIEMLLDPPALRGLLEAFVALHAGLSGVGSFDEALAKLRHAYTRCAPLRPGERMPDLADASSDVILRWINDDLAQFLDSPPTPGRDPIARGFHRGVTELYKHEGLGAPNYHDMAILALVAGIEPAQHQHYNSVAATKQRWKHRLKTFSQE